MYTLYRNMLKVHVTIKNMLLKFKEKKCNLLKWGGGGIHGLNNVLDQKKKAS